MLGSIPSLFLYHIRRSKESYVSLGGPGFLALGSSSELDCSFTSELLVQVAVCLSSMLWMHIGASG